MSYQKPFEFCCAKCGSNKLSYEQYVRSRSSVIKHDDGVFEYLQPTYDDNCIIEGYGGFCCADCGKPVYHYDMLMATEFDINVFLSIPPEQRIQQQQQWEQEELDRAQDYDKNGDLLVDIQAEE
jgi:hypothetical protein